MYRLQMACVNTSYKSSYNLRRSLKFYIEWCLYIFSHDYSLVSQYSTFYQQIEQRLRDTCMVTPLWSLSADHMTLDQWEAWKGVH
jgi:hypothetical protein